MALRALLFPALAVAMTATAASQIKWLQTDHNFGSFAEDEEKVSCTFKMVNTSNEPVVITNARATCGCTTPKYTREPIAPGDTAEIAVSYNAVGRPGRFSKKVYVYTNASDDHYTLTISGTVIGSVSTVKARFPIEAGRLRLRNSTVAFGDVTKGKLKTQFLEGYNQSSDTLRPIFTDVPHYIDVTTTPEIVAPGEQVSFALFFNSVKAPEWGINIADMTLHADRNDADEGTPIQTIASVNEDFSKLTEQELRRSPMSKVLPDKIDLGRLDPTKPVSVAITVSNSGKDPLKLRRVYSIDRGVAVAVNRTLVKQSKTATVTVSVYPSDIEGDMVNARINIITNDPITPLTTVRVVGEIIR